MGRHGGAERLCLDVARHFLQRGHEVTVFWHEWFPRVQSAVSGYPEVLPYLHSVPWRLYSLGELGGRIRACDVLLVMYHVNPRIGWLLTRALKGKVPLVWYAGEPNRGLWERWITGEERARGMKGLFRRTVAAIYGSFAGALASSIPFYWLATGFLRLVDYTYARRFDLVIAQSSSVAKVLQKIYRIANVPVIYLGIDPKRLMKASNGDIKDKRIKDLLKSQYFLGVGALEKHKNYEAMIQGFKLAVSQTGRQDVKLVIVGTGKGSQYRSLSNTASSMEGSADVKIFDWSPTELVGVLYRNCKAVVHTALWEPFGLTPLEGAFFGKPSIVSKIGGTAETVIDQHTGILVNPYDIRSISDAFQTFMNDEFLRQTMGENARKHMTSNFTISKMVERLEESLNRVSRN